MLEVKRLVALQRGRYSLRQKSRRSLVEKIMLGLGGGLLRWALNGRGSYLADTTKLGEGIDFRHDMMGVFIAGKSEIGNECTIYHHVTIGAHKRRGVGREAPVIGNRVFIGANTTIIGRCNIGDDARIGAGVTLVNVDIAPGSMIVNNSAFNLTEGRPVYPV